MNSSGQAFDIQPTSKSRPQPPLRSDASCFSPISDRKGVKPQCSKCGSESVGATFTEMDSGYPIGQVTGTAEFSCGCDGKKVFSIMSTNIDQWSLYRQISPGVFRLKKKTPEQRAKQVADEKAI